MIAWSPKCSIIPFNIGDLIFFKFHVCNRMDLLMYTPWTFCVGLDSYSRPHFASLRVFSFLFFLWHCSLFMNSDFRLITVKTEWTVVFHTFKNYFTIVFSVFSFQQNELYPNRLFVLWWIHVFSFYYRFIFTHNINQRIINQLPC